MASRKDLKKAVKYLSGEVLTACLQAKLAGKDADKVNEVVRKVLVNHNELISRISHTEPGNVKGFYKKLEEDLLGQITALSEELQAL